MNPAGSWDRRIERARELAGMYPAARELLNFYVTVAEFQKGLPGAVFPSQAHFRDFAAIVQRAGPVRLAEATARFDFGIVERYWNGHAIEDAGDVFFARALLQPYAEYNVPGKCPECSGKPVAGILREKDFGGERRLICVLCSSERPFARMLCPGCGENDPARLPVYQAPEFANVRVEACDSCNVYIKTVDLTKNALAVPIVDELAAVPLDVWARENGYSKITANLLGI